MTTINVKEIEELSGVINALVEALASAEASLETIHLRSYRQEDYLDTLCTVRAYAGSRAKAAKEIRTRYEGVETLAALDALLAFYKEVNEQEPVAYRYKIVNCFGQEVWSEKPVRSDTKVIATQPLYALPPSSAARIAELEAEIERLHKEVETAIFLNTPDILAMKAQIEEQAEKLRIAQALFIRTIDLLESYKLYGPLRADLEEALAALGGE